MKKLLCIICILAMQLNLNAQDTKIVIDNQTPGWLSSLLTYPQQKAVEDITITGYINKTDMNFVNELIKNYNLRVIDLSNVTTISDGNEHYLWNNFLSFGSEKVLQKVRLPLFVEGGTSTNGSIICSKVDTLEIGWEDLSVIGTLSIWNTHAKHLILLEGVRVIPYRYFMTQSDYDASYYNTYNIDYHVSLPATVEIIGGQAFGRSAEFDEPFSFPDSAAYIGKYPLIYESYYGNFGYAAENCWCERNPNIADKKFSFPVNLHYYNSLNYWTYHDGGISHINTAHEFASDTIVVYEKCDTLFAKLNAKVAYFYNRKPVQFWSYEDLMIDTLYVPDGCLSAYLNEYNYAEALRPESGVQIKAIKEMKKVKGIEIICENNSCLVGDSILVYAKILPEEAFNNSVKWSSSDVSIASVNEKGVVKTKRSGDVWIIAMSDENSAIRDSCKISVLQPVTGIQLDYKTYELNGIGDSFKLNATIIPEGASNKNIRWISSDESVCIVSNGQVIAVGTGTCVIIANTEDGGYIATCTVTNYSIGDVNWDGKIDISDVICVVNHILGQTPNNFHIVAADVNHDAKVDIVDVISIVGNILSTTTN